MTPASIIAPLTRLVVPVAVLFLLYAVDQRAEERGMQKAQAQHSAAAVQRSLVLFNALFALQTIMDIGYLWGGWALPPGMSHAPPMPCAYAGVTNIEELLQLGRKAAKRPMKVAGI